MEREKAYSGTAPLVGGERERFERMNRKRLSTDPGGLADWFVVAVKLLLGAVGVERRGQVVGGLVLSVNRRDPGGTGWAG
jgi:hypothetical protein